MIQAPEFVVAETSLIVDGWRYRAVSRSKGGGVRVIGLFAARVTAHASAIQAVWYQPPVENSSTGHWTAEAFVGMSAGEAVECLKVRLGLSAGQDHFWEIPLASTLAGSTEPIRFGVLEDDPIAQFLASISPETRKITLASLCADGHAAVDASPECAELASRDAALKSAAAVFENWITTNTPAPRQDLLDIFNLRWRVSTPCTAHTWVGPWTPLNEATMCNCVTQGPTMNCLEAQVFAEGEMEVFFPFPPPTGSVFRVKGSVNTTFAIAICTWERRCTGLCSRKIITTFDDRTTHVDNEIAIATTSRLGFYGPQVNPHCSNNSCGSIPPAGFPSNPGGCGFGTPAN